MCVFWEIEQTLMGSDESSMFLFGILVSLISGRWLLDLSRNSRIYDQEQLASGSVSTPDLQATLQNMLGCKKNNAPLSHHQDDMIHHFCSAILGIPPKRNIPFPGCNSKELLPNWSLQQRWRPLLRQLASAGSKETISGWLADSLVLNAEKCGKCIKYQVGVMDLFTFWLILNTFSCNLGWLPW